MGLRAEGSAADSEEPPDDYTSVGGAAPRGSGVGASVVLCNRLEALQLAEGRRLSAEQIAFIERHPPSLPRAPVDSVQPGELLSQGAFFVGRFKGVGKVYMHLVVDTNGSYGFGLLHIAMQTEVAVAVPHNDVLPFYRQYGLHVA